MGMTSRYIASRLTLCLTAVLAPAALGQVSPLLDPKLWADPPAESEPAFTAEQVAAWIAEMTPIIERAAGRPFLRAPKVKIVTRAAFAAALSRDLIAQQDTARKSGTQPAGDLTAIAKRLSITLATRYVAADKTVYLPASAVKPLLSRLNVPDDLFEPVVKLMLIHELAHALQDQHLDTGRMIAAAPDSGHLWTIKQLLEAHAVLVQRLTAGRLGLNPARGSARRLIPPRATPELLASLPAAQRSLLNYHHLAHGGAERAMAAHYRGGDSGKLWELLRNPPEILFKPQANAGRPLDQRPDNVLRGLDARFRRSWEKVDYAAGRANLVLKQFRTLERDAQRYIVANVRHVQTMNCQAKIADRVPVIGNVILFILNDPKAATALVGHMSEAQRRAIEQGPLADIGKIEPSEQRELKLSRGLKAYALRWSQDLTETAKLRQTLYWAIHGRYVVQVLTVNFDLPDRAAASIFDEVLTRVDALERASRKP